MGYNNLGYNNLVKLWDTIYKYQLHFFVLTTNSQKLKFNKTNTIDNSNMYEILKTMHSVAEQKLKNM